MTIEPVPTLSAKTNDLEIRLVASDSDILLLRRIVKNYIWTWYERGMSWSHDDRALLDSLPGAFQPPHGFALLAMDGSWPVGCVMLKPGPENGPVADTAEIVKTYVCPSGRKLGIGNALLADVCARARVLGYATLTLIVAVDRDYARTFYARFGFTEVESLGTAVPPGFVAMEYLLT